jgi:ribosomal protein L37E
MSEANILSNCTLCGERSLHVLGQDGIQSMQCISCGYASSDRFAGYKETNDAYKELTDEMKEWSKESNGRIWIPTIMTLPFGILYPLDVDNLVNHQKEMKWGFAPMVYIPEEEQKDYPVEGQPDTFYKRRYDTDNPKVFDDFISALSEVNEKAKEQGKPELKTLNLPKLRKR